MTTPSVQIRPWAAALLAAALGGCATPRGAAPPPRPTGAPPEVAISRIERDLDVPKGRQRIQVRNAFGDVHVRNSNAAAVGIRAVIQRLGDAPPAVEVELKRAGADRVVVDAVVAGLEDACRDLLPGGWRRARVDLTVFVPANVEVDVHAACDGRITAKNIRGDVLGRTEFGSMDVTAFGRIDVESRTGVVRARQNSGKWRGTSRIVSGTGTVIASLPVSANAALDVRGCAELRSTFEVQRTASGACWTAVARFGDANLPMKVESGSGVVELHGMDVPVN